MAVRVWCPQSYYAPSSHPTLQEKGTMGDRPRFLFGINMNFLAKEYTYV